MKVGNPGKTCCGFSSKNRSLVLLKKKIRSKRIVILHPANQKTTRMKHHPIGSNLKPASKEISRVSLQRMKKPSMMIARKTVKMALRLAKILTMPTIMKIILHLMKMPAIRGTDKRMLKVKAIPKILITQIHSFSPDGSALQIRRLLSIKNANALCNACSGNFMIS